MEQALVRGVSVRPAGASVTVLGLPDRPGAAASVFKALAGGPVRAVSPGAGGLAITVAAADLPAAVTALWTARDHLGFESLTTEPAVTEVALTGVGLRTDPIIAPTFCEALTRAGVPLTHVSITATACRVTCPAALAPAAERALREAFEVTATPVTGHVGVTLPTPRVPTLQPALEPD